MPRLQIMDTTIRDGQQSLWATRMQIGDMLPILPKMDLSLIHISTGQTIGSAAMRGERTRFCWRAMIWSP